jgi:predicted metal-dependent HD superfamily phosphohydrolase
MTESLRQRWHSSTNILVNDLRSQSKLGSTSSHLLDYATSDAAVTSLSNKWFEKVEQLYNEPHRAYHNMSHVQDMLASLDLILETHLEPSVQPKDVAITTIAAFFHDAIYNPISSTNEKDSANLFIDFVSELVDVLRTGSPHEQNASINSDMNGDEIVTRQSSTKKSHTPRSDMVLRIEQCIIATATHIPSADQARQSNNRILAAFLDADMSILGRDPDKYDKYAGSIRKEYVFVERSVYCEKRAEILVSFLPALKVVEETIDATPIDKTNKSSSEKTITAEEKQRMCIYATEKGRELWEYQAGENLRREIDMLCHGLIPGEVDR